MRKLFKYLAILYYVCMCLMMLWVIYTYKDSRTKSGLAGATFALCAVAAYGYSLLPNNKK